MIRRILALSLAHLVAWIAAAVLTYGTDLDQLRGRTAVSRAGGVVYDLLSFPHDAILRVLPLSWIPAGIAPVVIVASSLFWGVALYGAWSLARSLARDSDRWLDARP